MHRNADISFRRLTVTVRVKYGEDYSECKKRTYNYKYSHREVNRIPEILVQGIGEVEQCYCNEGKDYQQRLDPYETKQPNNFPFIPSQVLGHFILC